MRQYKLCAVEETGQSILKTLDIVNILECLLKKSMQVHTLVELEKDIKIDSENVHVNPNVLFLRLVILMLFFQFELTPFPTSLFMSFQMRKTNKAVLKHYLTFDIQESHPAPNSMFVQDGVALLHRVKWLTKVTYKDVVAQYLGYVKNKSGQSNINFDGYNADPSIKDHEHQRQAARTLVNIQRGISVKREKQRSV